MKNNRLNRIIDILKIHDAVTIKDLAVNLDVSEVTVRRDLVILSKQNIIKTIPGGALLNKDSLDGQRIDQPDNDYFLLDEEKRKIEEKKRIAEKAASLIMPDDTIIIDNGSTTEFITDYIPGDLSFTLICYALNVIVGAYKRKNCRLISAGGIFHHNTMMFESPEGISMIKRYRANKAFISAGGISKKLGVTTPDLYEVETKKAIMESCQEKILLVDSMKFNSVKPAYFAELCDFDIIITDENLDQDYVSFINDCGVTLYMV